MKPDLYEQAIRLLARRAHGRKELEKKLSRRAPRREISEVLDRLESRGYLNDGEFALLRARGKRSSRLWSNRRIALDLKKLGVSAKIVEQTLDRVEEELPEEEALRRAAESWIRASGTPRKIGELKRLFDHCSRRGYSPAQVRNALRSCFDQVDWD